MINAQIIDQAILLHRTWLSRLKMMMIDEDKSKIEVSILENPDLCELGRYLALDEVQSNLPANFFTELNVLHYIFHNQVGKAAQLIKEKAAFEEIEKELIEVDSCSQALVLMLSKAKNRGY